MKKSIKVLVAVMAIAVMVISMVGCGGSEKVVKMQNEIGMVKATMELTAKDDKLVKLKQISTIKTEEMQPEQVEALKANCAKFKEVYSKYEGVKYEYKFGQKKAEEVIEIPINEDMVKKLREANLIPIKGESNKLGLKSSIESLEKLGWKEVK